MSTHRVPRWLHALHKQLMRGHTIGVFIYALMFGMIRWTLQRVGLHFVPPEPQERRRLQSLPAEMKRRVFNFAAVVVVAAGCASTQEYRMLPGNRADDVLQSRFVVEGEATRTVNYRTRWAASAPPTRHDVTIAVEEVVKGDEPAKTLQLRGIRQLTPEDRRCLPNPYGVLEWTKYRIAYDSRRGDRFDNLQIVPLANTPVMEGVIARSKKRK